MSSVFLCVPGWTGPTVNRLNGETDSSSRGVCWKGRDGRQSLSAHDDDQLRTLTTSQLEEVRARVQMHTNQGGNCYKSNNDDDDDDDDDGNHGLCAVPCINSGLPCGVRRWSIDFRSSRSSTQWIVSRYAPSSFSERRGFPSRIECSITRAHAVLRVARVLVWVLVCVAAER